MKTITLLISIGISAMLFIGAANAGAPSASDANIGAAAATSDVNQGNGCGRFCEKINRHALKSSVLIRQLLAQSGVTMPTPK